MDETEVRARWQRHCRAQVMTLLPVRRRPRCCRPMNEPKLFGYLCAALLSFFLGAKELASGSPVALNTNLQLRLILNTIDASGANSIRIASDPRNKDLYYSKFN